MEYILTTNSTECFYERILKTDIFYDKDLWKLTRCTTYTCPLTTYKVHDLRLSTDNGEVVKVVVEVDSIVSFIDDRPNSYKNTLTNYTTLNVSTFNNSIAEVVFKKKKSHLSVMHGNFYPRRGTLQPDHLSSYFVWICRVPRNVN